jgi:hypothetical protein
VAEKISWYQQLDFQSLAMEFSGGKLKQKGFFHSVAGFLARNSLVSDIPLGTEKPLTFFTV